MTELEQAVTSPGKTEPHEHAPSDPPTGASSRRSAAWLGVITVVAIVVLSSNAFSVRDGLLGSVIPEATSPAAGRDAFTAVSDRTPAARTTLRSQPWWQDVRTLRGASGRASEAISIDAAAIAWRARARCTSGRIVVRAAGRAEPLIDAPCAGGRAVGEATGTGRVRVAVEADGAWRLAVSQQIDSPLVEPPLDAMRSAAGARKTATGSFYNIDKTGKGRATLYRQADGRYLLRLTRFFVSPTTDLELRLSTRPKPRTTPEYLRGRSVLVAKMDVTAGSLNYVLPAGIDPSEYRSLVVWCAATSSAYAATALKATA